jgi:hypothetical protein
MMSMTRLSGIPAAYLTEELTAVETLRDGMATSQLSFRKGRDS